jgi:hypothetical protein
VNTTGSKSDRAGIDGGVSSSSTSQNTIIEHILVRGRTMEEGVGIDVENVQSVGYDGLGIRLAADKDL